MDFFGVYQSNKIYLTIEIKWKGFKIENLIPVKTTDGDFI
jgi:hypothetical protein